MFWDHIYQQQGTQPRFLSPKRQSCFLFLQNELDGWTRCQTWFKVTDRAGNAFKDRTMLFFQITWEYPDALRMEKDLSQLLMLGEALKPDLIYQNPSRTLRVSAGGRHGWAPSFIDLAHSPGFEVSFHARGRRANEVRNGNISPPSPPAVNVLLICAETHGWAEFVFGQFQLSSNVKPPAYSCLRECASKHYWQWTCMTDS